MTSTPGGRSGDASRPDRRPRSGVGPGPADGLAVLDAELAALQQAEARRQDESVSFLAPAMIVPRALREVLAGPFSALDAEGDIGRWQDAPQDGDLYVSRYRERGARKENPVGPFGERAELLAQRRLGELFTAGTGLSPQDVTVNVQPVSGSMANIAVLDGLLDAGDPFVSLGPASGGHLSHGAPTHHSGRNYQAAHVVMDRDATRLPTELITEAVARSGARVALIGASSFPRSIDWAEIRQALGDQVTLIADIAHFAGPTAAGRYTNPLPHVDIVSLVGYKSMAGPRAGALLFRDRETAEVVGKALFPGFQSSPDLTAMAGWAFSARECATRRFHDLIDDALCLARSISGTLAAAGHRIAFGGTDTHLVVLDVGPSAPELVRTLELGGVLANATTLPGDPPGVQSGIRLGTISLAQRLAVPASEAPVGDFLAAVLDVGDVDRGTAQRLAPTVRRFVNEFLTPAVRPLTE